MKTYIRAEVVKAKPMTWGEFNKGVIDWCPASVDSPEMDGYLIERSDKSQKWISAYDFKIYYIEAPEDFKSDKLIKYLKRMVSIWKLT